jgi:hypothetical protein
MPTALPQATVVLLLAATTFGAETPGAKANGPKAAAVLSSLTAALRDQYGRSDPAEAGPGRPHAVFVVSARRLRRLKDWQREIDNRLEGVGFLRVADVPSEPGQPSPRFEDVAATLRKRVPEDVPILIDVERRFSRELDLDTREVNVLLFDASGRLAGRVSGRPTPDRVEQATAHLLNLAGVSRRTGTAPPSP